jgi:hypothetical protein
MAFEPISASEIDVKKPITKSLWEKVKNSLDFLNGQVSGQFLGNQIPNGSFEIDSDGDGVPDGWTRSLYPGGAGGRDTANAAHGAACIYATHPGGSGNGGALFRSDFVPYNSYIQPVFTWLSWATVASMGTEVVVEWYDSSKVYISSAIVRSSTSNSLTPVKYIMGVFAHSDARFFRLVLSVDDSGTQGGTAYFDGVSVSDYVQGDHIAVVAVSETKLNAGAVSRGKLKSTTASQSQSVGASGSHAFTLTGGDYTIGWAGDGTNINFARHGLDTVTAKNVDSVSQTATLYSRYIQASPPYQLNGETWGHFLFLLRQLSDHKIVGAYEAEDPPWAYNGDLDYHKDSDERIASFPHPWTEYHQRDPALDGLEITLVDLGSVDVGAWRKSAKKRGKESIIHDLDNVVGHGPLREQVRAAAAVAAFADRVKIRGRD